MKNLLLPKVAFALTMLIVLSVSAEAGRFYVVIASFSNERSAHTLRASLGNSFHEASVTFEADRQMYHVCVKESENYGEAEDFRKIVQERNGLYNAWVYADLKASAGTAYATASSSPIKLELYTGNTVLLSALDNSRLFISKTRRESEKTAAVVETPFRFAARTDKGVPVAGNVYLLTADGKQISAFKTGEIVYLSGDYGRATLTFRWEARGFNPATVMMDLTSFDKHGNISKDNEGIWQILFDVRRPGNNELNMRFYNIFHQDAAVLQGEWQAQLDLLASIMKSNPAWRMVINTHCTAGDKREIRVPGKEKRYFDPDAAIEKTGSDKHLTRARSEILRSYLASQGVDENRISPLAWGSLDPAVKGPHANLKLNERVEIQLIMVH